MSAPIEWNEGSPDRCPNCNNVTDPRMVCRWKIVRCCKCGADFTRVPAMAGVLPRAGVVCPEEFHHGVAK